MHYQCLSCGNVAVSDFLSQFDISVSSELTTFEKEGDGSIIFCNIADLTKVWPSVVIID